MEKLNPKALAIALGTTCALYTLILGWAAMFGWGTNLADAVATLYIGFAPTLLGGIIGAVWGFIDGAIAGAVIAFVYNAVAGRE